MFGIFNKKLKIDHSQSTLQKACNMGKESVISLTTRIYAKGQSTLDYLGELKDIKLKEEERLASAMLILINTEKNIFVEFLKVFKGQNITKTTKIVEYIYHNFKDEELIALVMKIVKNW